MAPPVTNGSRPAASVPRTTATSTPSTTPLSPARQEQQAVINDIKKKPTNQLTTADRKAFADALGSDKLLENMGFLGFFDQQVTAKMTEKLDADIAKFLQSNPNASLADIEKHVTERFKAQLSNMVVGKMALDMALEAMRKSLDKADAWEG